MSRYNRSKVLLKAANNGAASGNNAAAGAAAGNTLHILTAEEIRALKGAKKEEVNLSTEFNLKFTLRMKDATIVVKDENGVVVERKPNSVLTFYSKWDGEGNEFPDEVPYSFEVPVVCDDGLVPDWDEHEIGDLVVKMAPLKRDEAGKAESPFTKLLPTNDKSVEKGLTLVRRAALSLPTYVKFVSFNGKAPIDSGYRNAKSWLTSVITKPQG